MNCRTKTIVALALATENPNKLSSLEQQNDEGTPHATVSRSRLVTLEANNEVLKTANGNDDLLHHSTNSYSSSELDEDQENQVEEVKDLFGSDFSSEDPTYEPSETERLPADEEHRISRKKPSRWRKADPDNWASNIAKRKRIQGSPYISKNKISRPAKEPQYVNCDHCSFKCTLNFSNEARNIICRNYWSLDYRGRKNFILSNVTVVAPKRRLTESTGRKPRSFSKKCFFTIQDKKVQVCQKFFTKTICISKDCVLETVQNRDTFGFFSKEDMRGKKAPPNKTKPHILQGIKAHIESFPSIESHYERQKSKKKYLDSGLNITRMYELYKSQCLENNTEPASEITYRRTFATDYNFSFYKPKKDQCVICSNYNKGNTEVKRKLEQSYNDHQQRKILCNLEKDKDKQRAICDPKFKSVTFDLQALLQIPSSGESLLYYSRKLNVYNLTVYEADPPNKAFCFSWTEINGKRGSAEIASILHYYLSKCLPSEITQISLFSDTCSGQNRNQFVAAMLLWCAQNIENLEVIEQKFLESGHTYMEVDSMHSSIESAKKNSPVYSMIDWLNIFRRARKGRSFKDKVTKQKITVEPYQVKEFKFNEFFDVKSLAEKLIKNRTRDSEGYPVKWLKIKWLKFVKGESAHIYFKYNTSDPFKCIVVNKSEPCSASKGYNTRRQKKQLTDPFMTENADTSKHASTESLKTLYSNPLEISSAKKKDLMNLCKKGIIPEELHSWYSGLCSSAEVEDNRIPDVDASDSEEEEMG